MKKMKFALGVGVITVLAFLSVSSIYAATSAHLLPISDGTYLGWTPKMGLSHYVMVDESVCNGLADYNFTNTAGSKDSYGISLVSVPDGATITQVDIKPCASRNKSGSGSAVMNVFYRFAGIDSVPSGNFSLVGLTPVELATSSFSGMSKTKSATSTLEIGVILSSGNRGARLGRISTLITYTLLVAPSSLSAVASSTGPAISLTWSDNSSNESGFTVERNTDGVNFSGIATTSPNSTGYLDSGLTLGTKYYYRVRAFNSGAYTSYTNIASATTIAAPTVPAVPTNLFGTASSTSITLNWTDNSSDEDGFNLWRSSDGILYFSVATTGPNVQGYVDSGLSSGTWYHKVRAFNAVGYSDFSNVATT